jgi:hypothetical protein
MRQSLNLHLANSLPYFRGVCIRQLFIRIFILLATLYPPPWLHSRLMPFSVSLMK